MCTFSGTESAPVVSGFPERRWFSGLRRGGHSKRTHADKGQFTLVVAFKTNVHSLPLQTSKQGLKSLLYFILSHIPIDISELALCIFKFKYPSSKIVQFF